MGTVYWILVWEGWGLGLTMINPRLHTVKLLNGHVVNAFDDTDGPVPERTIEKEHGLIARYGDHWKVIRND